MHPLSPIPGRQAHEAGPRGLRPRRRTLLAAGGTAPLLGLGLPSCGMFGGDEKGEVGEPDVRAEVQRAEPGPAEGSGSAAIPFTARMLGGIDRSEVNTVCSPLSAQIVLTMAGMGAAGDTRAQMEDVLGGTMDELAEAANTISSVLAVVGDEEREADDSNAPEPAVASLVNGVWAQEGMELEQSYLEDLAAHFDSGIYEVDYTDDRARERGRERMNDWVAEATRDLIQDLISEDFLSVDSRMVLINALHLKAAWPAPLSSAQGPFTLESGSEIETEMLSGKTDLWYEDDLCRATAINTYGRDLALALVQPVQDVPTVLDAWAEAADQDDAGLGALLAGLEGPASVQLTVPAFDIEWGGALTSMLEELGMEQAFAGTADFSGITQDQQLFISGVVQKAVITVDKEGMEAAAATAAGMAGSSAPADPKELILDSPFLFVAYETSTLAPLVLGWIGDPSQTR